MPDNQPEFKIVSCTPERNEKEEILSYLFNVAEYALKPMMCKTTTEREFEVAEANYDYMYKVIEWLEEDQQ